ncbi:MAG: NAD(P)H-dependent oxidoreductase [Verrucomicrobia bacterium]|nr:NAD(P)H-dependent oxidoreductase [Verrucomicrobiota bacterium]
MITLVVGTNRPGSNTRKIALEVRRLYTELGAELGWVDLAELPAGIFAPGAYATKPADFEPFSQAILRASGLIIVTPEYNGGFPGVLKYFIDMLKFPESFERRPVCFVGLSAGVWGALRPLEQLQQLFLYRGAHIYPERVYLPKIGDMLDAGDRLTQSDVVERLRAQAAGFITFVKQLKTPNP